jgi:hypothetical protein
MQQSKVTIINISWETIPFNGIDFLKINEKGDAHDFGVYQICGHHNAYGHDTLLYIGKAQKQTFAKRINNRWEFIKSCVQPTSIRLGRIVRNDDLETQKKESSVWTEDHWENMIDVAEKILIKAHPPALNKQENAGLFTKDGLGEEHYLILNWNDYGSLLPEVSTFSSSYFSWDYNTPITMKDFPEDKL